MRSILTALTVLLCVAVVVLGWRDWEHRESREQWQAELGALRLRVQLLENRQEQLEEELQRVRESSVPAVMERAGDAVLSGWQRLLRDMAEQLDRAAADDEPVDDASRSDAGDPTGATQSTRAAQPGDATEPGNDDHGAEADAAGD